VFVNSSVGPYTTALVPSESCANVPGVPQAVNGGYEVTAPAVSATRSVPEIQYGGPTASRWLVEFRNGGQYAQQVSVWVLCASGTAG
jgi:hypothetical protein